MGLTPVVVLQPQITIAELTPNSATVILGSAQGPPGPPGPAGQAISSLQLASATGISAYLVAAYILGSAIPADAATQTHAGHVLGIVTAGAVPGALATIQYSGPVSYNGWSWDISRVVFLGPNGGLTQTPPTSGFLQQIGTPLSATELLLTLQPPILLN